jgi:hypothetical protein
MSILDNSRNGVFRLEDMIHEKKGELYMMKVGNWLGGRHRAFCLAFVGAGIGVLMRMCIVHDSSWCCCDGDQNCGSNKRGRGWCACASAVRCDCFCSGVYDGKSMTL